DEGSHMSDFVNNRWRLHWLVNKLVRDRFDLQRSSEILEHIFESSSLGWAVDLAMRMRDEHLSKEPRRYRPLVTDAAAESIAARALRRLRLATEGSSLPFPERWLGRVLFDWLSICENDASQVKAWTHRMLVSDEFVVQTAKTATQIRRTHLSGNRVSTIEYFVDEDAFSKVLDMEQLRTRARFIIQLPSTTLEIRKILERFLTANQPENAK
ncbi:MAG: hypothetical protein ACK5TQ_17415, partial [Acetobacteraceae bacterium]